MSRIKGFLLAALFLALIAPEAGAKTLFFGAGAINAPVGLTSANANGEASFWGRTYFHISLFARLATPWISLAPGVNWTPFGRTTQEDAASVSILMLQIPAYFALGPLDLKFGPGLFMETINGKGGSVALPNGTGSSTFYKPSRTSSTQLLYLTGGLGCELSSRLRLDADSFATGLLSSRRALGFIAQLSFGLI